MANATAFSTDLVIGVLPEVDSKKDPVLYNELARLRSAIRNLASALDSYTGASSSSQAQFSNGNIPFGSLTGLTANSTLTYNDSAHILATENITVTQGIVATGTFAAITATLGFFSISATPIIQPTVASPAAVFIASAGTPINDASTFDGYTLKQVIRAIRNLGLLA